MKLLGLRNGRRDLFFVSCLERNLHRPRNPVLPNTSNKDYSSKREMRMEALVNSRQKMPEKTQLHPKDGERGRRCG